MNNLYSVLGVEKGANTQDIKKAYFQLARVHHPDKGGNAEKFKEIQRAYEVLSNEQTKRVYDMTGQIPGQGGMPDGGGMPSGMPPGFPFGMNMGGGPEFGFNLDELFGMFGPGGGANRPTRRMGKPPPKIQTMKMDLKDFYYGQTFNILLDRHIQCKQCEGSGAAQKEGCRECSGSGMQKKVIHMGPMIMESNGPCSGCNSKGWKPNGACGECGGGGRKHERKNQAFSLPPGMKTGESVVLSEVCSEMLEFERPGDVHVVFELNKDSSPWIRQGKNEEHLFYTLTISLAESLLGLTVKLMGHPGYSDGLWVKLKGSLLTGDLYCLNDMGMPIMGETGKYGNALIQINVAATAEERTTLLGSGRTGSLEELFGDKCRKVDDGVKDTDILSDAYLSDFIKSAT